MRVISNYKLDLSDYPITMDAVEEALNSPTMKEVLEKNLLRGEINPIFPEGDRLRYFTVDPTNTAFLVTDPVLNKDAKELTINIIFDNNKIGNNLADLLEAGKLVVEMRGVNNNAGSFRLICFDLIPIEKRR